MMGFLKFFTGKEPTEYERQGDHLVKTGEHGLAKMEYEAALDKLHKSELVDGGLKTRLEAKLTETKESLAHRHTAAGEEILASGNYEDAEEPFRLALELTEDPGLIAKLEVSLQSIRTQESSRIENSPDFTNPTEPVPDAEGEEPGFEEYFNILRSSLSAERSSAYSRYGKAFQEGYVALNRGDFTLAANKLSQALDENDTPESYVPLELATAFLNLGRMEEGRVLMNDFIEDHPDSLSGHLLLCEIYWEMGAFEEALDHIESARKRMADPAVLQFLQGETLFRAGRYQEAKSIYMDQLKSEGWAENVATSLARTHEVLGEKEDALHLYGEIMSACQGCHSRVDPLIKQRYADLSFELGERSTAVLELYHSLVHEDPDHRAGYYRRICEIYTVQGNEQEARRYRAFADKAEAET
jgi:tetratricopeptide (TPR) repeat protein